MEDDLHDKALETLKNFQARGEKDPDADSPDPRGYHHPEIYFAIGNMYLAKNEHEKAEEAYLQALTRKPEHAYVRLNLAGIYNEQKKYGKSAENFSMAYEASDEKDPAHLYYAAVSWLMDGQTEPSVAAFNQLAEGHPEDIRPEWRENMVHALLAAGHNEEAIEHIKFLAEEYEGDKRVQWQEILLYQYLEMDEKDKAGAYVLKLTGKSPETAAWWKALVHVALAENNHENALVALTIYGYLTSLTAGEKKLLADLHLQVGIPVKAAPAYEAVMEQKPGKEVLRNLVAAYQQADEWEKAYKTIDSFESHEQDPDLLMLKADILYRLKRFEDALQAYNKAAKTDSHHSGRAWLMAGYAAWQADDMAAAADAFENAAVFENQKSAADSALKQLRALRLQ